MKLFRTMVLLIAVVLVVGCAKRDAQQQTDVGEKELEITLAEVTPLADVIENPSEFLEKEVLIEGEVTARCGGKGCWISLKVGESDSGLIVTTTDESYVFPEDCVGKTVQIQGALMLKNADEIAASEAEAEGADHKCPNPEYYFKPLAMRVAS